MSKSFDFHNDYHLGDCLYQLHYQIRLWYSAQIASTLWCNPDYHAELAAFIPPQVGVKVAPLAERPSGSLDCWIGFENYHTSHPNWHDYVRLYVDWFKHLSRRAGVHCPIQQPGHMLFDSPAILGRQIPDEHYDVLLINAQPLSDQWDHNPAAFLELVTQLRNQRLRILTTHPCGIQNVPATIDRKWKVADIARQSMNVDWIIAIDTGPTGSTFNVWNQTTVKGRFVLHKENFFTHAGSHAIHKWADLMPALHKHGVFSRMTN